MTACPICQNEPRLLENVRIRSKYNAQLLQCPFCNFTFLENPTWLPEAYQSPIDISDTGYVARNLHFSRITSALICGYFNPQGTYLDYGAGYGLFVRLMRDIGFNFKWQDTYTKNLFAHGFEWEPMERVELTTAFEVFEHLPDPRLTMAEISPCSDAILFSTELIPQPAPTAEGWWYYGFSHGQHVSFHTIKSLSLLGAEFGYELLTDGHSLHLFHRRLLSKKALGFASSIWFQRLQKRLSPRRSLTQQDNLSCLK